MKIAVSHIKFITCSLYFFILFLNSKRDSSFIFSTNLFLYYVIDVTDFARVHSASTLKFYEWLKIEYTRLFRADIHILKNSTRTSLEIIFLVNSDVYEFFSKYTHIPFKH